jgi:hypothetical protein
MVSHHPVSDPFGPCNLVTKHQEAKNTAQAGADDSLDEMRELATRDVAQFALDTVNCVYIQLHNGASNIYRVDRRYMESCYRVY